MSKEQTERDAALAAWAQSDEVHVDIDDPRLLRGEQARAYGRDLLARVGRQPLDPSQPKGHRSPRRQVRLPEGLSESVDALAAAQGRKASEVMRDAIDEYVSRNRAS